MAKWIVVHDQQNQSMWINSDLIWRMYSYKNNYTPEVHSMVHKSDQLDDYFQCRETPEEIMILINKERELIRAMENAK